MYQLNEIHLWGQHHDELLQEAQSERLARELRASRETHRGTGNGRQSTALRRAAFVWGRTSVPFFRA